MNVDKYPVMIAWSEDDQVFVSIISALPGCISHGDTASEALQNVVEAATGWIQTAVSLGRAIPRPMTLEEMHKHAETATAAAFSAAIAELYRQQHGSLITGSTRGIIQSRRKGKIVPVVQRQKVTA